MTEKKLSRHDQAVLDVRMGNQLQSMLKDTGWTKVLKPSLESRRSAEIRTLINAKEHDEIIRAQQAVREIDGLFTFIKAKIALGEQAEQELKKE